MENTLKQMYKGIQHQLNNLIPEKWESIYLYASVIKQFNNLETWEMYFYYIPKGVIKKNPINVYEVPSKFNVDEEEYLELVNNLCNTIKALNKEYSEEKKKDWTNMVIEIKDSQFLVEYNDDDLLKSQYKSEDRHIIFKHKYLNIPIQSFSKKEKAVIQRFLENEEYEMVYDRYLEYIEKEDVRSHIEFGKDKKFEEDLYSSVELVSVEESKPSFIHSLIFFFMQRHSNKVNERRARRTRGTVELENEFAFEPRIQILNGK